MRELCMFDIMELPEESLVKVLPKAPTRVLVRLLSAYPRTVRQPFWSALTHCTSAATLEFIQDQINSTQLPSVHQIREAEREFIKIVYEENVIPEQMAA